MLHLLDSAVSFLAAAVFAAVWGAHVFETAVLFRVWAAEPAKALPQFVARPIRRGSPRSGEPSRAASTLS